MDHKVFISYSSQDARLAERIYERLERDGIKCWMSSRNVPPGADFQSCIVNAIAHAELVLLVFSSEANHSNEIAKELSLASKKVLIPVRIEDVLPEGAFKFQLTNRQFFDLFEDFEQRLDQLSKLVHAALGGTQSFAMPPSRRIRTSAAGLPKWAVPTAIVALLAAVGLGWYLARSPGGAAPAEVGIVQAGEPAAATTGTAAMDDAPEASVVATPPAATTATMPVAGVTAASAAIAPDTSAPVAYTVPASASTDVGRELPSSRPSFDCARASTRAELLVCDDDHLARLDQALSIAYRNARMRTRDRQALQARQNEWRRQVRDACTEADCVAAVYEQRTRQLDAL